MRSSYLQRCRLDGTRAIIEKVNFDFICTVRSSIFYLQPFLGRAAAIFHRGLIVTLAPWHKMPAVYYRRNFVIRGGLISYGYDLIDQNRRAAGYVDRILNGEKPADLPV